jgi:hypothetical protein
MITSPELAGATGRAARSPLVGVRLSKVILALLRADQQGIGQFVMA